MEGNTGAQNIHPEMFRAERGLWRGDYTYGVLGDDGELPWLHALLGELPRRVSLRQRNRDVRSGKAVYRTPRNGAAEVRTPETPPPRTMYLKCFPDAMAGRANPNTWRYDLAN